MPINTMGGVVKTFFKMVDSMVDSGTNSIDISLKMQKFTLDVLGITAFGRFLFFYRSGSFLTEQNRLRFQIITRRS